jgi:hypothetical protein
MPPVLVRYAKASAMTGIVVLMMAVTAGLLWAIIQPAKYAFHQWGLLPGFAVCGVTVICLLLFDRRIGTGRR